MTGRQGFALRVAAAFAAMFLFAPIAGWLLPDEPFHRVMTRALQVGVVIALLVKRPSPRTWGPYMRSVGLRGPDRGRRALTGALVAIGLLIALVAISFLMDGRTWTNAVASKPLVFHLALAVAAAAFVSVFEEFFFRGYLYELLGGWGSALLYAAVHFFKPLRTSAPAGGEYDPLLAFRRIDVMFESWFDPRIAGMGMVGLFLFGLALNRLRERTGTLYLGIGLHAGLVFALAIYRRWIDGATTGSPWVFGGARLHDGLLGVLFLAGLCVAAYRAPLPRFLRPKGEILEFEPPAA